MEFDNFKEELNQMNKMKAKMGSVNDLLICCFRYTKASHIQYFVDAEVDVPQSSKKERYLKT